MEYVRSLDADDIEILWQGITVIEAQDILNNLWVNTFMNLKKESREKSHKKLLKQAYPSSFSEAKSLNEADIMRIMRG